MSDFPINVKVDPGDSKTKIDDVHRTVERAEKQADAAKTAFTKLGDAIKYMAGQTIASATKAFGSLADAIQYRMNTQITAAQRGFASMADAIQREQAVLKSIRGDIEAYSKDVAILNSLMDRGKISAKEYDAALAGAGKRHGIGDAEAPKAGMLDGIAGQALAIAGPAAIAAKALGAVTAGFEELRAKAQETREVNASMLRYTDSILEAKIATEQMREVSHLLGTDLKTTSGAFLDIADAAGSLNLSHEKLVDVTKSLGLIMKTEGKSIADVGSVMQTLEFALSKGTISSGELGRIMKQFPPIAALWREEFGATNKQLLDAADNGQLAKLGLDRLITSIHASSETVDRAKQQWHAQNTELKTGAGYYTQLNELMELNKLKASDLTNANRRLIDSWGDVSAGALDLGNRFDEIKEKAHRLFGALRQLGTDKWGNTQDTRNMLAQVVDEAIAFGHQGTQAIEKFSDNWKKSSAEMKREAEQLAEAFAKIREPKFVDAKHGMWNGILPNSVAGGVDIDSTWTKAADSALKYRDVLDDIATRQKKYAAELKSDNDGVMRGLRAIEKELRDTAGYTESMLKSWYGGFEDALVKAVTTGKLEFSSLVDSMIADLARLAIRKAIIGGLDILGSSGLDFKASAGLDVKIPHFAAGGGGMVRGGGGMTDNVFVPLMATQGERVIVQTQGQQMSTREAAQRAQSAPAAPQPAVLYLDQRALLRALNSPMGARVLDDLSRRYPGLRR